MVGTGHLVHGMGHALEPPAWPAITFEEAGQVLPGFPTAGRPTALLWHSPRPFSAAALVETVGGTLLLKRHHRSVRTPGALAEEHRFMAHLRAAGLAVPDVLPAEDGTGAVALGSWSYELHRAGVGIDLYRERPSWTPFLSHDHARQAGAALARLHLAARGYAAPLRGPHPLVASYTIVPARDPLAAAQAYVAERPALASFLEGGPWREALAEMFVSFGAGLAERLAEQPSMWTHNDWHPSNLLWSSGGTVCTVFDFGLSARTSAVHDLATAIERTAIPWLDLGEGREGVTGDARAAVAVLDGYRKTRPLADEDIVTIVRLLPLVHLEFALSEVDYFAGALRDAGQAMLAWRRYLIGHARWFATASGEDFLRRVEREALS